MTDQTITLKVPDALFQSLKRRAEQTDRTVESEVLEAVAAVFPEADTLSADLADAVSQLTLLEEDELWRAARSHLNPDAAAEMEHLHSKRQSVGLTEPESQSLASLVHQYERFMLVRAKAAVLLRERGHVVAPLLGSTPLSRR